jgi:hypothetical protein
MEWVVAGNRMSWLRLSFSVKRAASTESPNRFGSCGTQGTRRRATAPSKPRLTSAAKGITSPVIVRLARRAGYQETGLSSSTEAHQTNPARFVGETSNPDVLSDVISSPFVRAGAMRTCLASARAEERPPSHKAGEAMRSTRGRRVIPSRGFGSSQELRSTWPAWGVFTWRQVKPG